MSWAWTLEGVPCCLVWVYPPMPLLLAVGARRWVQGSPPASPPWRSQAFSARNCWGGPLALSLNLLFSRAGFLPPHPPFPPPSGSPRPHGRPRSRRPLRWLDPPPSPPTPVSRTREAKACHTRTWRHQLHRISAARPPLYRCPPPSVHCPPIVAP